MEREGVFYELNGQDVEVRWTVVPGVGALPVAHNDYEIKLFRNLFGGYVLDLNWARELSEADILAKTTRK